MRNDAHLLAIVAAQLLGRRADLTPAAAIHTAKQLVELAYAEFDRSVEAERQAERAQRRPLEMDPNEMAAKAGDCSECHNEGLVPKCPKCGRVALPPELTEGTPAKPQEPTQSIEDVSEGSPVETRESPAPKKPGR